MVTQWEKDRKRAMDGFEVLRGIKNRMAPYEKGTVSNSCHLHLKTMPLEKKLGGMESVSKEIMTHLDVGRRMQGTAGLQDFKS